MTPASAPLEPRRLPRLTSLLLLLLLPPSSSSFLVALRLESRARALVEIAPAAMASDDEEVTHRDQRRVEYGGLTPCSDPSEPPADELLAIESDADETSGGNDADDAGPDVTGDGKGKHDGELDGEAEVKPTSAIGARSAGARATRDDIPRFGTMCLYVDLPIAIHKRYHAGTHKGRKRRRTT